MDTGAWIDLQVQAAYGQFVLQRDRTAGAGAGTATGPTGWRTLRAADWTLWHHPALPVVPLQDAGGAWRGWLLGWAIGPDGFVTGRHVVAGATPDAVAPELADLGGRHAALVVGDGVERFHLDGGGTLAAVYRPDAARVASTTSMALFDEPDHLLFARPVRAFPNDRPNRYFPAGLTAAEGVRRLLPDHHLDLRRFEPVRDYPGPGFTPMADADVPDAVDALAATLRHTIDVLARSTPRTYMALTAGRDSRALLACARPWLARVELVTFDYTGAGASRDDRLDLNAARRTLRDVTAGAARRHIVPVTALDEAGQGEYLWRIGFAAGAGKGRDFDRAARTHLDLGHAWVSGFGGELGRSSYAQQADLARVPSPEGLVRRVKLTGDEARFAGDLARWRAGVPDLPPLTVVDLAYLENRVGGWASAHLYGTAPFAANVVPFAQRRAVDLMLRLPVRYKRSYRLVDDLIARTWPELGRIPFQSFSGARAVVEATRNQLGQLAEAAWHRARAKARATVGRR